MKKIKTSDISTGAAYPPSKKGLDFLQQSYQEVLAQLAQTFVGNTPSTTIGYVLYGCVKTLISGTNYSLTAGAIYFNGEVYAVDAIATIPILASPILTITTTNDPVADPTIFTDMSSKNVHNIRKMVLSDGILNSGTLNFDDLFLVNDKAHAVGSPNEPAFQNSYTANTTVSFKKSMNTLFLDGGINVSASTTGDTAFTLPIGYRPSVLITVPVVELSNGIVAGSKMHILTNGEVKLYFPSGSNFMFQGIAINL